MALTAAIHKKNPSGLRSLKVFQFVAWYTIGCFNPFVVLFLMHRSVNTATIGFILMMNSLVLLVGQPLWGMISDRLQSVKKVFLICLATSALLNLILPWSGNTAILTFMLPLCFFFFCALSPLLDSWTVRLIKSEQLQSFGSFRLWGSIGFSVAVILLSKLISITSINAMFVMFGLMSAVTVFICIFYVKDIKKVKTDETGKISSLKDLHLGRLFKNYYYVTYLLMACIMFMTLSSVNSFLPVLMKQVGGSDELYGVAAAISAFSEVPVFFLSSLLIKRYKPVTLILASILVYTLRLFIYSIAGSPLVVIFAQSLQGFSYGLFLTGGVYYIDSLTPEGLKSTAQTAATATYFGLSGIVGNYVTGRLIEGYGIFFVYRTGVYIDILVFILFLSSLFLGRRFFSRSETGNMI